MHLHVRHIFLFFKVSEFKSFIDEKYVIMCTIVFIAGASIHACPRSSRHLVALEKNSAIFNVILVPLYDSLLLPIVHDLQSISMACEDDDEPIRKGPRKSRLST